MACSTCNKKSQQGQVEPMGSPRLFVNGESYPFLVLVLIIIILILFFKK